MSDTSKTPTARPLPDQETLRQLVKRVMDDSKMHRLEACTFVAGMFPGNVGWDVLRGIEAEELRT